MSTSSHARRLGAIALGTIGLGAVVLGSVVLMPAAPALAADCANDAVTTLAELNAELTTSGTVYLGADIGVPTPATTAVELIPGQPATIDLCGRTLAVEITGESAAVHVPVGASLTIVDSAGGGLLRAVGGEGGPDAVSSAGIGATGAEPAGEIIIESGTIEAVGAGSAAGIGGGSSDSSLSGGSGGNITIHGGTVTATGSNYGAGIGTGRYGSGGDIIITGGIVTADSPGWSGAGIGTGGNSGLFGSIQISGGVVHASGSPFAPNAGNLGHGSAAGTPPNPVVLSGLLPSGVVLPATSNGTGSTAPGAAPLQLVAGPEVIIVTADEDEFLFAEISAITATPSATTAAVGDMITVQAFAVDTAGTSYDVSDTVTLSSSVPEDVIVGDSVTFTHASPHTITVDYGGLTASFTVEVSAVLPPTGGDETQLRLLVSTGLTLLGVGAGLLLLRRRATSR